MIAARLRLVPHTGDLENGPIAVVDDDPTTRALVRHCLEVEGYDVVEHTGGAELLANLGDPPLVVCLDLGLDDMSGLDVLRHLSARDPTLPVIVVTATNEVETAVDAMRRGAYDYLAKPIVPDVLRHAVRRAIERRRLTLDVRRLRHELGDRLKTQSLVGRSPSMKELAVQIERVLDSDVAVAISGESGTGKELVARAIHDNGRRRSGPFVAVNCASIPESLHESELFGHEKGAFTGAVGAHRGRFEQASGGTLFLDEIGEMSAATQATLLRTLQERTIRRVGGTEEIPVDVRIVCATHRDLAVEAREGRFREDLYFRLVVYPIAIPPLRDRTDDIPLLVAHFLRKYKRDVGREVSRVSADALEAFARYPWPGNVRELENVVHRAMLASDGDELGLHHLPVHVRDTMLASVPSAPASAAAAAAAPASPPSNEITPLEVLERREIEKALAVADGNVPRAAKLLGMGRATLYRRLAELKSEPPRRDEAP